MKYRDIIIKEIEGGSQAVRHSDTDWEAEMSDKQEQDDTAITDEGPYAIIWHAQYHEWYGAEDPSTNKGRYKPKGDAGNVLAKNIPSYRQAQKLLSKVEKYATDHGEWGHDIMVISQSTGPMIVPMSELKDHFHGYNPDMQEYGATPAQYDYHGVIDMAKSS